MTNFNVSDTQSAGNQEENMAIVFSDVVSDFGLTTIVTSD